MPIQLPTDLMVSVSGFRGVVGAPLTPELVSGLGAAYGTFLREEGDRAKVVVGRDSRTSGPMLERAVVAGLLSAGCEVVELGIVPTPTLMLAVRDTDAAGGIAVTASHNPAEWNALKFAVRGGTFLPPERMDRFQAGIRRLDPVRAPWDRLGEATRDQGAVERHIARILDLGVLDVDAIRARRIRVALDCVNGAGGVIMPALLDRLGCRVHAIGMEPDGHFPRDPEPTAANLGDLAELVRASGAEIGFAVDPDADRLSLVDETGVPLGEDLTLALAADVVLRRGGGCAVTNLSTSRILDDVAWAHGCRVVRAPVGEINVVVRMIDEGAVVGGEGNGGVILPALHHTRDAPVGAALLLQYLVDAPDATLSDRVGQLPPYHIVKDKVTFPRALLDDAYAALSRELPAGERDDSDGMRLEWTREASWLHVRPSGTEPVVRLIAEAPAEASARGLVDRAKRTLAATAGTGLLA
ncbi:MAG: phosphoglucosamine mutase [Gemmatimonadota bacterium]|nr:phosphoglucosamine mutase [Gemmatimonadota bacterium]